MSTAGARRAAAIFGLTVASRALGSPRPGGRERSRRARRGRNPKTRVLIELARHIELGGEPAPPTRRHPLHARRPKGSADERCCAHTARATARAPAASGQARPPTTLALGVGSLSPATVYYFSVTVSSLAGEGSAQGTFTIAAGGEPGSPLAMPSTPPLLGPPPAAPSPPAAILTARQTRAQPLAKALKACREKHDPAKRKP